MSFEESIEDVRSDMNPEMSMDEKEVRRLVMEILDQLPEDQRIVIGMFYYEEMPVKDIAAALEVSENTVKSRLSYGRKNKRTYPGSGKAWNQTLQCRAVCILPVSASQSGFCICRSA